MRHIGHDQLGVRIRYLATDGSPILTLNQWSRWPRWLEQSGWQDASHGGQPLQILDEDEPHHVRVRRQCGRTHITAGPRGGAETLDPITDLRVVEPASGSLRDRPEVAFHSGSSTRSSATSSRPRPRFARPGSPSTRAWRAGLVPARLAHRAHGRRLGSASSTIPNRRRWP